MAMLRLLRWLGALIAAFGAILIALSVITLAYALTACPGPITTWQEQLHYITANLEAILTRLATGLAMIALGLFLYLWTGRQLARTEQQP